MDTVQSLTEERKKLQDRVHELVEKLETFKKPDVARVPKEYIIRSEKEQEAAEAFEKLEIDESNKGDKGVTKPSSTDAKKVENPKGAKQKGGGAANKEVEKPLDVSRLDLRIGKIVEVDKHPDADSLYIEKIDCGDPTGPRTVISGLVKHVPIEEMRDRLVVVLCNLKPAKMRGILSEAMVMCASTPDKVELLKPPENVKPGDRVVFEKYPGEPDAQLNPKKKIWEQLAPEIKTNEDGVAHYKDSPFRVSGNTGFFSSNLKNVQIR